MSPERPRRPFERPDERQELRFHLEKGRSVLMLAPRRVGKSWLMKRVAEDLRGAWAVVECDVEGMVSEEEFLRHLCTKIEDEASLKGKVGGRLKQVLEQLGTREVAGGWQQMLTMDPRAFATSLVQRLAEQEQDTVIFIDEIALFVLERQRHDPEAARTFLYHLRRLRQAYPKVRWVFTGSIGLDSIGRRHEIAGALVDLQIFAIEPFDSDAARALIDHLCDSGEVMRPFTIDDAAFSHLAAQLGWLSPYYIEKIAGEIRASGEAANNGRRMATTEDVERAFQAMLLPAHRNYFVAWEEHLSKNFEPPEADKLELILNALSRKAEGELMETLLSLLSEPAQAAASREWRDRLTNLVADGYLAQSEEDDRVRYRFRSGLLRRYWSKYHAS